MLFVGGLVAVGLLAFLGAFYLSLGDRSAAPKATIDANKSASVPTMAHGASPGTTHSPAEERHLPAVQEGGQVPALNGGLQVLLDELSAMRRQMADLEQRLDLLGEQPGRQFAASHVVSVTPYPDEKALDTVKTDHDIYTDKNTGISAGPQRIVIETSMQEQSADTTTGQSTPIVIMLNGKAASPGDERAITIRIHA